jgi:hypothetical protein
VLDARQWRTVGRAAVRAALLLPTVAARERRTVTFAPPAGATNGFRICAVSLVTVEE